MPKIKPTPAKAEASAERRTHMAEPAHSIINKCGGVRSLSRELGVSAAAVTRWQTERTEKDRNGCNGIIPEFRRRSVMDVARALRKRVTKSDFLKS
jgi:hypothetical protein